MTRRACCLWEALEVPEPPVPQLHGEPSMQPKSSRGSRQTSARPWLQPVTPPPAVPLLKQPCGSEASAEHLSTTGSSCSRCPCTLSGLRECTSLVELPRRVTSALAWTIRHRWCLSHRQRHPLSAPYLCRRRWAHSPRLLQAQLPPHRLLLAAPRAHGALCRWHKAGRHWEGCCHSLPAARRLQLHPLCAALPCRARLCLLSSPHHPASLLEALEPVRLVPTLMVPPRLTELIIMEGRDHRL